MGNEKNKVFSQNNNMQICNMSTYSVGYSDFSCDPIGSMNTYRKLSLTYVFFYIHIRKIRFFITFSTIYILENNRLGENDEALLYRKEAQKSKSNIKIVV